MKKLNRSLSLYLSLAVAAGAALPVAAASVAAPETRPALMVNHPEQSWLQASAWAGKRLVSAGERGLILLSDDEGKTWRQAKVPVSVGLTAVSFANDKQGWAVGHFGVVLHSVDGGETWTRQLDGVTAAQLVQKAAKQQAEQAPNDPAVTKRLAAAERLVADGPDKPFFDVHFADEKTGYVVGAYNLIFRTRDGGQTWQPLADRVDNPKTQHLYAIRAKGNALYLIGEQGLVFRSGDGGEHFQRLTTPYQGSYFNAAVLPSGELVVAGLRGNAYRSVDQGTHWEKIELPAPVSVLALAVKGDTLFLGNQAGQVFASSDQGRSLKPIATPPLPQLTSLLPLSDGSLLATSLRGAVRFAAAK